MKQEHKKDSKVHMTALKATELTAEKPRDYKHDRPTDPKHDGKSHGRMEELLTVADQIAGTTLCTRNWRIKNADKHFPHSPLLRRVDKHFQSAKGGPLLVDEPKTNTDVADCARKMLACRAEGQRYVFIPTWMELEEAEALMKLPNSFFEPQAGTKDDFATRLKRHFSGNKVA